MYKLNNSNISLHSISRFKNDNKTINPFLVVIEDYKTRYSNILNNIQAINSGCLFYEKYTKRDSYKNSSIKYITKLHYTKYSFGTIVARKGYGYKTWRNKNEL